MSGGTTPALAATRAALAEVLAPVRSSGGRVAFVPTMGALHDGHAGLVRLAREVVGPDGAVVVSVFVNPLQFDDAADLERYPRTLDADLAVCAREGADVVFAPAVDEVYPGGPPQVTVHPGPLADVLEGASRPGHFAGVLTVVAKLFGLVRPDVAVFGEKDYQQLTLVRRMVADLCLGVEVVGAPTRREADGLAMSSRNRHLDAVEREQAAALHRVLAAAAGAASQGVPAALAAARAELREAHGVDLDYLAVTDVGLADLTATASLDELPTVPLEGRVLVAARVGTTRLIDNLPLVLGTTAADVRTTREGDS
ncbi:pantoate--beta-alanine ligase [Nocardioides perillae]|uniref:Pantothenate synthetase n=1 Tax=Nocardioides perillae TaxID=1119534 RepID=A0A7Y9RTE9_9ACTN|nr:pantoate--beta-alanine ligase [Nocardioides perillae]